MTLTGNKGEWSEIYTLFRLLGEGKVHAGDENLNKLDIYYPILNIIRQENKLYEYKPDIKHDIVIIDEDGTEFLRIPMERFIVEADALLSSIKNANHSSFAIPETECFMNKIGCSKLKAPSQDKADIHIVIHDLHTSMSHCLGFSIKSQLGSDSTLLNATTATNITYRVIGGEMSDSQLDEINSIDEHLLRMQALLEKGFSLKYDNIEHQTFKNNLFFLDCCMPEFIADCLFRGSIPNSPTKIRNVVELVAKDNPLNFKGNDVLSFYEHKMKVLLIDSALGMTAAKEWKGRYDANGGYLVVKKDGDIVCYHFYNRNDVEDYLYNNTRFERGSRKRHHFGSLYRSENNNVYMKLNLQIRFTK